MILSCSFHELVSIAEHGRSDSNVGRSFLYCDRKVRRHAHAEPFCAVTPTHLRDGAEMDSAELGLFDFRTDGHETAKPNRLIVCGFSHPFVKVFRKNPLLLRLSSDVDLE